LLAVFSAGIISISCNKVDQELSENSEATILKSSKNQTNGVVYSDEILVFNTMEDFKSTLEQLTNKDEYFLDQWEAKIQGFTSMRTMFNWFSNLQGPVPSQFNKYAEIYYREDLDDIGACHCSTPVESPFLNTLLNFEGVVQIGDTIYKMEYEKIKIITDGDRNKIPSLGEINENRPELNIFMRDVERTGNTCYNYFDSKRRTRGRMDIENWLIYGEAFLDVSYQEKNWLGCWVNTKTDALRMKASWQNIYMGSGANQVLHGRSNKSTDQTKYNVKDFHYTIAYELGKVSHCCNSNGELSAKRGSTTKLCKDSF
jgi:hypothetical protein